MGRGRIGEVHFAGGVGEDFDEGLDVDFFGGDDDAAGVGHDLELLDEVVAVVFFLEFGCFPGALTENGADGFGQLGVMIAVHGQDERGINVVGHADVALNLVELGGEDDAERVLLTVDFPRFEGEIEIRQGHGDGGRAQMLPGFEMHGIVEGADCQP